MLQEGEIVAASDNDSVSLSAQDESFQTKIQITRYAQDALDAPFYLLVGNRPKIVKVNTIYSGHFDIIITTCSSKDAEVWKCTSRAVSNFIQYRKHLVIVPGCDIDIFQSISHKFCEIVSEDLHLPPYIHSLLDSRIAECGGSLDRKGWYIQQFAKLVALSKLSANQIGLIWDADTIPLKPIDLIDHGKLFFYQGTEYHQPYFDSLSRLLGMQRLYSGSFISQCIAAKGRWMREMIDDIESTANKPWIDAIIDSIDFSEVCGFSEYELLGNYFFLKHPDEFLPINRSWLRRGGLVFKHPHTKTRILSLLFSPFYDYIAFEASASREQAIRNFFRYTRKKIKLAFYSEKVIT